MPSAFHSPSHKRENSSCGLGYPISGWQAPFSRHRPGSDKMPASGGPCRAVICRVEFFRITAGQKRGRFPPNRHKWNFQILGGPGREISRPGNFNKNGDFPASLKGAISGVPCSFQRQSQRTGCSSVWRFRCFWRSQLGMPLWRSRFRCFCSSVSYCVCWKFGIPDGWYCGGSVGGVVVILVVILVGVWCFSSGLGWLCGCGYGGYAVFR